MTEAFEEDWVSEAVTESLERESPNHDDYNAPWQSRGQRVVCDCCGRSWHGLKLPDGCPGAWGDEADREEYRERQKEISAKLGGALSSGDEWYRLFFSGMGRSAVAFSWEGLSDELVLGEENDDDG